MASIQNISRCLTIYGLVSYMDVIIITYVHNIIRVMDRPFDTYQCVEKLTLKLKLDIKLTYQEFIYKNEDFKCHYHLCL